MPALEGLNKKYSGQVAVIGLHVFGVPQAILIDSTGKILAVEMGKKSLDQFSSLVDKHL